MFDSIESATNTINGMYAKGVLKNRLAQLKIHSFRRFAKESELNFTFPLTVIVGKNGSGKTTVMKAIKLLADHQIPQSEFFETVIDDGGFQNADISYILDGKTLQYKRLRQNEWGKEGDRPDNLNLVYIQTKTMVGAIDKSFLYDDIGKHTARIKQVEYVIRQAHKLKQNTSSTSARKQQHCLSNDSVGIVNYILQRAIRTVKIIRHKYYSGTWATSVIFNDGSQYSEYNAGSGEFLVASMVDRIESLPSGSILLLDEPEVSLHPEAQKRLIGYLLDVIKRKKLQIIITTHSTHIIDNLPKAAIKCFRVMDDGTTVIEENVFFQNAFLELGANITSKKHIIVEDSLAQTILQRILEVEGLSELVEVEFYPGGASNIKKYTILTYSKTKVADRYILFDGDQKKDDVPDFNKIPEADKTHQYLKAVFKNVVGIDADKIDWGVDANKQAGRKNTQQEQKLIQAYLEFYKTHVGFLPQVIPEDIIYNEARLKILLGEEGFPDVSHESNAKARLNTIAVEMGQDIGAIEYQLVYWFIKQKNSDYNDILAMLKGIIEG